MTPVLTLRAVPARTCLALAVLGVVFAADARADVRLAPTPGGRTEAERAPALPKIRLIATGGTIANGRGRRLTAEDLLIAVPAVDRYARTESEQFSNLASAELTLADWLRLARRINQAFAADGDLAGVVVTSGTDTLEEIAYFLNLTVTSPKPVVVVGSMREPGTPGHDGAANLLAACRVAADRASRNKGVLVVLNDEINAARDVTKSDALRLDSFRSHAVGVLGVVDPDRVVYYREPLARHTTRSEFDVAAIQALPRVDIVLVYQDAPGDLITAAVSAGARGVVIAIAGAGGVGDAQAEGLAFAARHRVFIVAATRTGGGRVPPSRLAPTPPLTPGQEQRQSFTISAQDLAPVKARILLMLALTKTANRDDIQRMFEEY